MFLDDSMFEFLNSACLWDNDLKKLEGELIFFLISDLSPDILNRCKLSFLILNRCKLRPACVSKIIAD